VLGTIAADTKYYPLKSKLCVDGYGWGVVEDRGGAIKGDDRIDVYFDSRKDALRFGRKRVDVHVEQA
jgi:3D (Asp-Asp-Asp) domain-containing protein